MSGVKLYHPLFNGEYVRRFTQPDGSCFFHSVAGALNYENYREKDNTDRTQIGIKLRKNIVTRETWTEFADEFASFAAIKDAIPSYKNARGRSFYANDAIIRFTSRRLKVGIVILDKKNSITLTPEKLPESWPVILLALINKNHFEYIVKASNKDLMRAISPALPYDSCSVESADGSVGVFSSKHVNEMLETL